MQALPTPLALLLSPTLAFSAPQLSLPPLPLLSLALSAPPPSVLLQQPPLALPTPLAP